MKWSYIERWISAILWMVLMIFLSRQQGEATGRLSGQIAAFVAGCFTRIGIIVDQNQLNLYLRTAAHVVVYFIWSILLYRAFCWRSSGGTDVFVVLRPFILTIAVCFVGAMLDELQKKWIPGRHCDWREVVLNCFSALAGTVISLLVHRLWLKRRSSVNV